MGIAQDLSRAVIESIENADAELVLEETLCLVAVTTARAAEVGLRERPELAAIVPGVLLDLPAVYHDYVMGGMMVENPAADLLEASGEVTSRLQRKKEFYAVHFPANQFPGPRILRDKMPFWMGRISPPGLTENPDQRLARLQLVDVLHTHLKLVLAFARGTDSKT
jgi:hypothetical protein